MKELNAEENIPPNLPAPHFDDEATLVSARPVVPIATAKANERSRIIRRVLPFIVIAGVFGILVGGGIGYYEKRDVGARLVNQSSTLKELNRNQSSDERLQTTAEVKSQADPSTPTDEKPKTDANSANNNSSALDINNATSAASAGSFTHTFRSKTGIHPPMPAIRMTSLKNRRPNTRRGAARIQEIFAGSNPE